MVGGRSRILYMFIVHFLIFNFHDFGKVTFLKPFFVMIFWMSGSLSQKQMLRACSSILFNVNSNELRIKIKWRLIWFQILHICAQLYTILYLTPKYQINKSYQIIVRNKEYSIPTLIITFLKMSFFHSLVCDSSFR